jgi:Flp pilus assembly protein TadD
LAPLALAALLCACSSLSGPVNAPPEAPAPAVAAPAGPTRSPAPVAAASAPKTLVGTAGATSGTPAAPAAPAAPAPDPAVVQVFASGVAALQAGRMEEAQRHFVALTRSNPELAGPHANLGIVYRRAGKLDDAAAELQLAVQDNSQQAVYWNQLGIVYRLQGHFTKARSAYEKAIAIDPNYSTPKLNLGVLFDLYLWDGPRALEQYQQYLALTPGGDEKVSKWIADLKNRTRGQSAKGGKERE